MTSAVPTALPILDCHQHFFDRRRLDYPVLTKPSPGFEALVGDYAALPRVYLPEDYARDVAGWPVAQTVWAEFMADDPRAELRWVDELTGGTSRAAGMIAQVDFASPGLGRMLDIHGSIRRIRAVRQHLGWHPTNPLLRYASRPDLLTDPAWRHGLAQLDGRNLCCELEVFAPQLPDLAAVAAAHPHLQFVVPVMGWPLDLTRAGREVWKRDLAAVAACGNVAIKIFGLECIFGVAWTVDQVRPWILDAIELFGPERSMFASHLPICRLAGGFGRLYGAYLHVVEDFSPSQQRQLLHDTAARVYGLLGAE